MNHVGTIGEMARRLSRKHTVETDAECLGLFVATRCEEAFAELVTRYGPTVLGVCRRTLGNTPEADEAFQATFLVLMKKADTIRPAHRVGAWLYGVAMLASKKARTARTRRQLRHVTSDQLDSVAVRDAIGQPDLYPLIDEELARLPEKFRLPILLCGLRELTTSEAATELGWPIGTLASRLSRGRGLLHRRLMLRGVLGATASAVLSPALAPAVPSVLLHTTLTTALGGVFAPVPVMALVSQVVFQMKVTFLRWVAASAVGAAALVVWGGSSFTPTTMAAPIPASVVAKPKPVMDRVKLLNIEFLLDSEEICKEIGLSDVDHKAIKESATAKREAADKKRQAQAQPQPVRIVQVPGPGGAVNVVRFTLPDDEIPKMYRAIQDELVKDVCEKLKPEGVHRLKQIYLLSQGPRLLVDRLVIRELQLSAEQEDKLDETLKDKHVGMILKDNTEKMAEELDQEWKAARKMLSAEQTKKLDELLGKSFSTVALLQASPNHEFKMTIGSPVMNGRAVIAVPAMPALPVAPPVPEKK